jgi:hypothetical protein
MQEFMNLLATDPQQVGRYRLLKETWRGFVKLADPIAPKELFALALQRLGVARSRRNGAVSAATDQPPAESSDTASVALKLYQPAHQRFYLVTSCLVCQAPGLPDRKVDPGKQEQAGFVLRRLLPPTPNPQNPPAFDAATWQEHGWVGAPDGNTWQKADTGDNFIAGEEILPMFATNYSQDDGRKRRLFAGVVPVAKREAYLAASRASSLASTGTDITARKILLLSKVIGPWKQLVDRAAKMNHAADLVPPLPPPPPPPAPPPPVNALNSARVELQGQSYYVLVDFANYLRTYLKTVWDALINETPSSQLPDPSQAAVLDALRATAITVDSPPPTDNIATRWHAIAGDTQTLLNNLVDVFQAFNNDPQIAIGLDQTTNEYTPIPSSPPPSGYPQFLFPLADPEFPKQAAQPPSITLNPPPSPDETDELPSGPDDASTRLDRLAVLIARALVTADATVPQPAIPLAAKQPADALTGWFVIRCVYRRPACGPLHDDVVSPPTEPFQLAGFFDPDAPARPIRIGLPIDTSPAGLRKFDKNTAFVISDTLCGQIQRIQGITFGDLVRTVLPFPLHQDLNAGGGACKQADGTSLGTICSLSIPIITICALIILILMVSLLDIIFHWLPFFLICFPFKGMSAKKS